MDHLWSPWRYRYVTTSDAATGCIFCDLPAANRDEENLIIHRGRLAFVLLNRFPYTNGHLMVAPYAHVARLEDASEEAAVEMMLLGRRAEAVLRSLYRPHGLNLGMNIGESAGAGVAGHIHLHVLPRWTGDTNFMTTVGETRVLPESLEVTWQRVRDAFTR
jgi:ATP adenylyltransferase